eukprot:CAMPEP_0201657708 /NCGR_PEP_ID=MMETSP0494-20130426/859_1 /ASSEMBLY_ACC=CAM_ASM_000839 /TAXON_ID=420259 /ORGANISM="Thalassiosira gravida, Strain GMp14c1" /LENGTH=448 /DNA_ID=CAMNT_0048134595 /DNA_START=238 /DNA_END=1584 /DNA_ORIENTATION=-
MHVAQNKRAPAYNGARFDVGGFCLAHSDVPLCKSIDGKYKTIRKICFKCGSATLMNNGHYQKKKLQGYRRKTMPRRGLPSELYTSSGIGTSLRANAKKTGCRANPDAFARTRTQVEGEGRASKYAPVRGQAGAERRANQNASTRARAGAERQVSQDAPAKTKARAERRNSQDPHAPKLRSKNPIRTDVGHIRRGRTLSPLRKSLPKGPNRPSSSSEIAKKKVTTDKIKEMMHLMPPLYTKHSTKAGSSKRLDESNTNSGKCHDHTRQPADMPFDENGYCRAHPKVRLAEKNSNDGEWEIVSGVCPQCCVSAVLACKHQESATTDIRTFIELNTKKCHVTDSEEIIGKVMITSDDSHQTELTSESSSYPSTPGSVPKPAFSTNYFTSANRHIIGLALDVFKGEQMVADLNKSCVSGKTAKTKKMMSTLRTKSKAQDLLYSSKEPPGRRL